MLATEYAEYYKIEAQKESESDLDFRQRVSVALREMGHIIEAHEAYQDQRYEESDNVMTGLFGAIAQALQGTHYGGDPVGNDIAAGLLVRHQMSPEGQAKRESDRLLAQMLMAGLSPDDIGSLLK